MIAEIVDRAFRVCACGHIAAQHPGRGACASGASLGYVCAEGCQEFREADR